jgi:glycosylphosphatidylinositol deacylase
MDRKTSEHHSDTVIPSSVIVIGHSMGGVVARTMLIMSNYAPNSINTILTMSAPHIRPPVSFDRQIVQIYQSINTYWREAYSQKWASNNPLYHVILVSIAGGGLDTVVPSDYATVDSLVPPTHGFTTFTTSIPFVWTSMDHQAILWCDQFRKVFTHALYDIIDARRSCQTKPRAERMRILKRHFLTGLEEDAPGVDTSRHTVTMNLPGPHRNITFDQKAIVRFGAGPPEPRFVTVLAIPSASEYGQQKLTLLTDVPLGSSQLSRPDSENALGDLERLDGTNAMSVFACSTSPFDALITESLTSPSVDVQAPARNETLSLSCRSALPELGAIYVPSLERRTGSSSLDYYRHIYYIEHDLWYMRGEQFFVVYTERQLSLSHNFLLTSFSNTSTFRTTSNLGLVPLLLWGLKTTISSKDSFIHELRLPMIKSSLLAYDLEVSATNSCFYNHDPRGPVKFSPIINQLISHPSSRESKYYHPEHGRSMKISVHGEAPFVMAPDHESKRNDGLSIRFWIDPNCDMDVNVALSFDLPATFGLLYMRYRTALATFPLFVTALVMSVQFWVHDMTGVFISFSRGLNRTIRGPLPIFLWCMPLLALLTSSLNWASAFSKQEPLSPVKSIYGTPADTLLGTNEPLAWGIMPVISLLSLSMCASLHYVVTAAMTLVDYIETKPARPTWRIARGAPSTMVFKFRYARQLICCGTLLLLASNSIPYQFPYLIACLVQLFTTYRALRNYTDSCCTMHADIYHYSHSLFLLMLWLLPINMPVLVVWVRELSALHVSPFESPHSIWSILPFMFLVEVLTQGSMIPRLPAPASHITLIIFLILAIFAVTHGVTNAYKIHDMANIAVAWLVFIQLCARRR